MENNLDHVPMTALESQLKIYYRMRKKEMAEVFSPEEMLRYYEWMADEHAKRRRTAAGEPKAQAQELVSGGDLHDIAGDLLSDQRRPQAVRRLQSALSSPREIHFFSERQHILLSRFYRYLPPYWTASDFFEILYCVSGSMPVWFDRESFLLTPGQFLIIPPGMRRACTCPNDENIVYFFMMRKDSFQQLFAKSLPAASILTHLFLEATKDQAVSDYLRFSTGRDEHIEQLICQIRRQYKTEGAYSAEIINALTDGLLLMLLQGYEQTAELSKNNSMHFRQEYMAVLKDIQDHFATTNLPELSVRYGYSTRQLIRIISSATGMCFKDLLRKLKMDKAVMYLQDGSLPAAEIAQRVGYENVSSFYRAFGQYYGCTPLEYVQRNHSQGMEQTTDASFI